MPSLTTIKPVSQITLDNMFPLSYSKFPLLWYINGIFRSLAWRVSIVEKGLIKLDAFTFLVQSCCVCYAFYIEMIFVSSQVPFVLKRVHVSYMLLVFIHAYCWPTWFPYQMMSLSFNSNTMGVISGAGTASLPGHLSLQRVSLGVNVVLLNL